MSSILRYVCANFRRQKLKNGFLFIIVALLCSDLLGLFIRLQELDYKTEFAYPLNVDVKPLADALKFGKVPSRRPIYNHKYNFYKNPEDKCRAKDKTHYDQIRLVFLVKSRIDNFARRQVIRRTWGDENRISDAVIRTVFLIGNYPDNFLAQGRIEAESTEYSDIIQGDFRDSYYNNTVKTLMGLRWCVEHCPTARFYMFVDDDYYVSTKNLLNFVRNPVGYPLYLNQDVVLNNKDLDTVQIVDKPKMPFSASRRKALFINQQVDFDLPDDVRLYTGFVFDSPRPQRHKWSKWFVDIDEYPFDQWPSYVTAGAYVLSRDALVDLYFATYFVEMFRFDDIYLGIVAKKIGLEPLHCDHFHYDPPSYSSSGYEFVVASHGFQDPNRLAQIWTEQKDAGFA